MAEDPPSVDLGLRRFTVLRHGDVPEPHYDFLFETSDDSALVTFRLQDWPPAHDQPAVKLRDHRRLYLTYEGEIPGGDRGRVDRVAGGTLHVFRTPDGWLLHHPDGKLFARFESASAGHGGAEDWRVSVPHPA